jgi:hypothetical protein
MFLDGLRHGKAESESPPQWHAEIETRTQELFQRLLHPSQDAFVEDAHKRRVIRAGRRGGKTAGMARRAIKKFLGGRRVLYAVPTQDQMDRFWSTVKRGLEPAIDAGHIYKNETLHLLEIPRTEIRIRAKTAFNADTLRGDYADELILDEYQLMNEDAWGVVGAPMLLDNNGDATFIYSPPSWRSAGMSKAHDPRHAAKLYAAAAADNTGRWQTFTFASHANPYISPEALAEIVGDMTDLAYRQEILAEDIEDTPGALWTHMMLDRNRVLPSEIPDLVRIGVALDPAATSQQTSDEMGIVAGGVGIDGHGYVLRDASLRGTPTACARAAIFLYDELEADVLVGEVNNGGEWIGTVIQLVADNMYREGERKSRAINYKMVHASRGKQTRAEPVAVFSQQNRWHHVGVFPELESQMCTWSPGMLSPDRMDSMVWLGTELLLSTVQKYAGTWGR